MSKKLKDVNLDELKIDNKDGIFTNFPSETNLLDKVVDKIVDLQKDLATKTELSKISLWNLLNSFELVCNDIGLEYTALIFQRFKQTHFRYMISSKRKGREELIEILNAISHFKKEQTETQMNLNSSFLNKSEL